jgi:hypothetical protein
MRPKAYNADLERYTYSAQKKKKKKEVVHINFMLQSDL